MFCLFETHDQLLTSKTILYSYWNEHKTWDLSNLSLGLGIHRLYIHNIK